MRTRATAATPPNVVIYLLDDVDLERIPLFARQDSGAAAQLTLQKRIQACVVGTGAASASGQARQSQEAQSTGG